MKKITVFVLVVVILTLGVTVLVAQAAPPPPDNDKCTNIQSGELTSGRPGTVGVPIEIGYDEFGYNYQAHMFVGTYDSSDRNIDGTYWGDVGDYVNDTLMMKWSNDWLANVDCNGDGKLDRGLVKGEQGDVGGVSLGWLTNHNEGEYFDDFGDEQHYTYFVKIVYVGAGGSLWGQYDTVQEVLNDPADGYNGIQVLDDPGLGLYVTR